MAFKDWKKRSDLLTAAKWNTGEYKRAEIERACAAAYRAGEREGIKVAEMMAISALMLLKQLGAEEPTVVE